MILSFQKCPLGKKCNLHDIFHTRKRALCSRKKGHLAKLGGAGPPCPPGSYAPEYNNCDISDIGFLIVFISELHAGYTFTDVLALIQVDLKRRDAFSFS
jgi:hypothetical protein